MRFKDKGFTPITDRDYKVVKFLWAWKVSTTAALTLKFFPHCAPNTAYNRLLELEKRGVILGRADITGKYFVWTLTADGNARMRNAEIPLRDDGYRSEYPAHDLLVAAVHNGDWLLSRPDEVEVFTEQQLKRYAKEAYPNWVPTSDLHRPDGYWRITEGDHARIIALEVELHHKSKGDYERIAMFYKNYPRVSRVLWIVPRPSTAKHLATVMKEEARIEWSPHIFTTVREFESNGWAATILAGEDEGSTIGSVLGAKTSDLIENLGDVPHKEGLHSAGPSLVHAMLNVSKTPHKSKTSKFFPIPGSRQQ